MEQNVILKFNFPSDFITQDLFLLIYILQNKCRTADPDWQNLGRSSKPSFFVIYKFGQNCAQVQQVSDLILKTVSMSWSQLSFIKKYVCTYIFVFFISYHSYSLNHHRSGVQLGPQTITSRWHIIKSWLLMTWWHPDPELFMKNLWKLKPVWASRFCNILAAHGQ